MATEWKKIFIDLRAIKYDSARLFLRQLENTLDLAKWINEGIAEGEINALSSFTLNGLTPTTQTFDTTEDGTNFTISSAGSVHSFNLPIASATNTGKLSKEDWARFDAGITPTLGDLESNSNAANIIGGTNCVIGGNVTIDFNAADGADDGILLSSDWNIFSAKLGSASNGLTVTGTLVELGGALTKNTSITGLFNFEINPYNNTSPVIFVKGLQALVGIGTNDPKTLLCNTNDITSITDGVRPIGGAGLAWVAPLLNDSYAGAFYHPSTTGSGGKALLLRVESTDPASVIVNATTGTTSRFIVKGDGKVGVGIYTPLYKFDTLLGTSEAAYIRSTNISFNITDGSSTNGYFNLNTGSATNASHRFNVTNYNNVNSVLNYADIVVSAFGGNSMMLRSYSSSAAHGALANTNHLIGDTLYVGSASTSGVTYIGGYTGSLGTVTFSSQVTNFNVNKTTNFSASTFNLNYAGVSTVGASGAASALPAQPLGYVQIQVNGTNVKVPYYNV